MNNVMHISAKQFLGQVKQLLYVYSIGYKTTSILAWIEPQYLPPIFSYLKMDVLNSYYAKMATETSKRKRFNFKQTYLTAVVNFYTFYFIFIYIILYFCFHFFLFSMHRDNNFL